MSVFRINHHGRPSHLMLSLAVVIVITWLLYLPCLSNAFVNWDDDSFLLDNPLVREKPFSNILEIFTTHQMGRYYPLMFVSFQIEYYFFKLQPLAYHLTNIILHLLNVTLVFYLLLYLSIDPKVAIFTTLLFGIHPLQVEAVAWVSSRKDVLFAFFYLCAVLTYAMSRRIPKHQKNFYTASIVFFALGLFAKVSAVTLPFTLLVLDYYKQGRLGLNDFKSKTPYFFMALVYSLVILYFLEAARAFPASRSYALSDAFLLSNFALLIYLAKLIFPFHLSCIYPLPDKLNGFYLPLVYMASVVVLLIFYAVLRRKTGRYTKLCFIFFFITIFPALHFLKINNGLVFERFVYLPSIGIFLMISAGYNFLQRRNPARRSLLKGAGIAYLIFLGVFSWMRGHVWQNSETLWTDAIKKFSTSPNAYVNRSVYLSSHGRYDEAFADVHKAIRLDPKNFIAYLRRAELHQKEGNNEAALADYTRALELPFPYVWCAITAYNNRGNLFFDKGKNDLAISDYNKVLQLDPGNLFALLNRGTVYYKTKEWKSALEDFDTVLTLSPHHPFAEKMKRLILSESH